MSEPGTSSPLVEQVRSGTNKNLQRLAAEGLVPLPPEELIPLQVFLAVGEDQEIAALAKASLDATEMRVVRDIIPEASFEVLEFFGLNSQQPAVLESVIQRRDLPASLLGAMAPRLPPDAQEILLLRQDLIIDNPEILDALEQNPGLSSYSERRVLEYRQHLLGQKARQAVLEMTADAEPDEAVVEAELEEIEHVVATVKPTGDVDEVTGLSESQIRAMTPSLRSKLARGASRSLRSILIKDKNPTVACAVLTASAITEPEIEQASANRNIVEDVLTRIANKREWISKYTIMHNLVRNPRTPVAIALRNLPRLSMRDMANLKNDRNIPDAVRQQAIRLHRAKSAK